MQGLAFREIPAPGPLHFGGTAVPEPRQCTGFWCRAPQTPGATGRMLIDRKWLFLTRRPLAKPIGRP
jgi:hypothetical protein